MKVIHNRLKVEAVIRSTSVQGSSFSYQRSIQPRTKGKRSPTTVGMNAKKCDTDVQLSKIGVVQSSPAGIVKRNAILKFSEQNLTLPHASPTCLHQFPFVAGSKRFLPFAVSFPSASNSGSRTQAIALTCPTDCITALQSLSQYYRVVATCPMDCLVVRVRSSLATWFWVSVICPTSFSACACLFWDVRIWQPLVNSWVQLRVMCVYLMLPFIVCELYSHTASNSSGGITVLKMMHRVIAKPSRTER